MVCRNILGRSTCNRLGEPPEDDTWWLEARGSARSVATPWSSLPTTAFLIAVPCWAWAASLWVWCPSCQVSGPFPLFFGLDLRYTLSECAFWWCFSLYPSICLDLPMHVEICQCDNLCVQVMLSSSLFEPYLVSDSINKNHQQMAKSFSSCSHFLACPSYPIVPRQWSCMFLSHSFLYLSLVAPLVCCYPSASQTLPNLHEQYKGASPWHPTLCLCKRATKTSYHYNYS